MDHQKPSISSEIAETLKALPHTPGVYQYLDQDDNIIYVGKAIDLYRRIHQYFQGVDAVGPKTALLVKNIRKLRIIPTISEFDALLLEASLIQKYQPKYNSIAKDDKSPLYIKITFSENLPHLYMVRKPLRQPDFDLKAEDKIFGPFQSAKAVRSLIHVLRHIVPYCLEKNRTGKPCFYTHLGLCNPCPSRISGMTDSKKRAELIRIYRRNLFRLSNILSGKSQLVIKQLNREMQQFAQNSDFESATLIRNQLTELYKLLEKHYDPMVYNDINSGSTDIGLSESRELHKIISPFFPSLQQLNLIEGIDISNTGGSQATGSLVVFQNGIPEKSRYRRFKIKTRNFPNDFAMMQEVITRRFGHNEWEKPDLLLVDGGKGQLAYALKTLKLKRLTLPVIGLAKREEEIILQYDHKFKIIRLPLTHQGLHLIQRVRDEAHRFAIGYHRLLRSKKFSTGLNRN